MEFDTFEEARRSSLFQAAVRPTVVIQRDDKFLAIAENDVAPTDKILGRCSIKSAAANN